MKQATIRIITGVIITTLGVGALFGALNVIPFWDWFGKWWPALIMLGGVFTLIGDYQRNYLWGAVLLIVGGLLLSRNLDFIDFNIFSLIGPILVIAFGVSILTTSRLQGRIAQNLKNSDDISVIFSGNDTINKSQDYKGGRITAIFGGATLDLRDAKITKEATLEVFTFCGGVELRVPRNWNVVSKATPIAGGVENKSQGSDSQAGPTLVVIGTVMLGGVEIKT